MRSSRATLRQTQTFTCDIIYISIGPPDNPMIFYENDKTRVVVQMIVEGKDVGSPQFSPTICMWNCTRRGNPLKINDAYVTYKIIRVRLTVSLRETAEKQSGLALSLQYHMLYLVKRG